MNSLYTVTTALLAIILTGCVPFTVNGARHTLVIGIGIVSTPATNKPAVQVVRTKALGVIVTDQPGIKAGIGYSSSTVTQVSTNSSVLVEVSDKPLKIESK